MKPIEIDKEDVEIWFEQQSYDGKAEEMLHQYITALRHFQKEYNSGEPDAKYSGTYYLTQTHQAGVISTKMLIQLIPLIRNTDLEYTITHNKDETTTN